ncbi:MAG: glycosyltransferase [Cetobacterium sp.]|uniref:glycosyltransferase n=1 Tax=Cetobacterium sp. TaxID=2071632 RepID=UPI003F2E67F3
MKKKIIFINGHLNVGGVEKSLLDLLKNIDYSKFDITLLLLEEKGDYINEVPIEVNIVTFSLNEAFGPFLDSIKKLLKAKDFKLIYIRLVFILEKILKINLKFLLKPYFIKLDNYDIVISYRPGIVSEIGAFVIKGKKRITWWHHGEFNLNKSESETLKKVYKKFNKVIAVSKGTKEMLLENLKLFSEKIDVIPNIIDKNCILKQSLEKSEENIKNNLKEIKIVSIGRLSKEKGMENCVYASKTLKELGYKIKWYLIGDGKEYEFLYKEISKYKLENEVFLLGKKKNPFPYLKNADIYVHPSYVESMSITVLEAMVLKKPIIAFNSIGPSEYINHKKNGLLIKPTQKELVKNIINLVENKKLCEDLKTFNNHELLEKYSQIEIIKKIYNLFERV